MKKTLPHIFLNNSNADEVSIKERAENMYFIKTLSNNAECQMQLIDGEKHSQLNEAAPEFFNHSEKSYGVHVIILCSDYNSDWNNYSFKGQFQQPNALNTDLPSTPEESSVDRNFCISQSKRSNTILEAIVEIAQFVKRFYSQDFGIDAIANNLMLSENKSWNANQAKHISKKLFDGINNVDEKYAHQKIFLLLTMPKKCFDEFGKRPIPSFIEYVVIEQPDDPDIEEMTQEKQKLEKNYITLRNEVLDVLKDTITRLKALGNDLKKEPEHDNTIAVQNKIDSLIMSIQRTKNDIMN